MTRPVSLIDFVDRFEPACSTSNEPELEACWYRTSCRSLVAQGEALGYPALDVRRCALEMLRQSAIRLEMAKAVCNALSYRLESGIKSIVVAGSAARGEATKDSDIDFNLLVTQDYISSLYTRRSEKAKTSHELLMGLERELRKKIQGDLLRELKSRGYPETESKLTLKPFTVEQLSEFEDRKVALVHLLNVLFSATPVYGVEAFDDLLEDVRRDENFLLGAILGRIALLRRNRELARAEGSADVLKAAHAVAACMSAILCAGLGEGDPQVPYWWTFNAISATWIDEQSRAAIEMFFAVVTLCRGDVMNYGHEELREFLETALASLPDAIDAIIEYLSEREAPSEVLEMWDDIAMYVTDPQRALELARDLGMVRH